MSKTQFRKLILGDYPYIASNSTYKRVILTGLMSMITAFISIFFLIMDMTTKDIGTEFIHVACILLSVSCFLLNRTGSHSTARILLALVANIIVYLFTLSEPRETGLYLFFVTTSVGAIAAFGLEEKPKMIFFVFLSLTLFLLSIYWDPGIFTRVQADSEYIRNNLLVNFIASLGSTSIIVYFMVDLNRLSERELRENDSHIRAKHEELITLNADLDRFVYSTSHDLRSPISSMRGLVNLSQMAKDRNEVDRYLKMMEGQLLKLSNFIKDIADYSRNARLDLNIEKVGIRETVDAVLDSMKFMPGSDQISTQIEIPDGLEVTTDPTRLQMILANLISNSIKYVDQYKSPSFIKICANFIGPTNTCL